MKLTMMPSTPRAWGGRARAQVPFPLSVFGTSVLSSRGHPLPSTSAPEVERFPELMEENEVPETQRLGRMGGCWSVAGGRMEGTRWPPGAQLDSGLDSANNPSECGGGFLSRASVQGPAPNTWISAL